MKTVKKLKENLKNIEEEWKLREMEREGKANELVIIQNELTRLGNEEKELRFEILRKEKLEFEEFLLNNPNKPEYLENRKRKLQEIQEDIKEIKNQKNDWIGFRKLRFESKFHWVDYIGGNERLKWQRIDEKIELLEELATIKFYEKNKLLGEEWW